MNRWGLRAAYLSAGEKIWCEAETLLQPLTPNGLLPHVCALNGKYIKSSLKEQVPRVQVPNMRR